MALVGWMFDLEILKRVLPGLVAMNPMTATLMILLGLSLLGRSQDGAIGRTMVAALAAFVIFIAAAKLVGLAFDWPNGVDEWMFADQLDDGLQPMPNRMAPNTAVNFVLLGFALLLMDVSTSRGNRPTELLAATAGLVSVLAILGYAYHVDAMYGISRYIPMALHTAVAFLLLAIGVLCARAREGWMALVTAQGPGGTMVRRLLPALLAMLATIGWLRVKSESVGLLGSDLGVTYYTLTTIVLGTLLILHSARSLNHAATEQNRLEEERKKAFAELKSNETRISSIIDTAYDAFISIDSAGLVIDWNEAAERMFGWSRDECLGRQLSDLIVPPQNRAAHEQGIRRSANSDCKTSKFLNRRVELTALRREGAEFPIQMTIWPLGSGLSRIYNAFISDITERVEAEKNIHALHSELITNAMQLEQNNRELEAFSYTISHDLRAPLRHIDGYARMLHEDVADKLDGETRRYLDEISEAARRMGTLIDDLLAFSRLGRKPLERIRIDMRALIDNVVLENGEAAQRAVHISELPSAQADPILLRQVWTNLLSNAIKYSLPRGTAARIEISGLRDGAMVRYQIRDNGVGFDMRYSDKLFGVFQRLHSDDEFDGTGVGLAIVQRIVTRHGGTISAEAELGVGATFTFALPVPEPTTRDTTREETKA